MTSTSDQGTYEMLWDCPACGTPKLLGVTHRFCPACGTPQDPEGRYFPSDAEKVAVQDHALVGRDRSCPACDTPNAAEANNCMACGCPLDGAEQVDTRADVVTAEGQSFEGQSGADAKAAKREKRAAEVVAAQAGPPTKEKSNRGKLIAGGGVAAGGVAALMLWSSPVELEVTGHEWERTIEVESYGPTRDGAWCNRTPSDARNISQSRRVKEHRKVADGEECSTRRVDNGNGSFSQKRECRTKYRKEPVYAQWCEYTVDRWHHERDEKNSGSALDPVPSWPVVKLAKTGECVGCEREGRRSERYEVFFVDNEGEEHGCEYGQEHWASFAPGSSWAGEVGVMGGLACDEVGDVSE